MKVKHHNHIIGKYRRPTHQELNLNISLTKKILVVFHNLESYDSHLTFQEIGKYNFKINVIPKTLEKYMSLTIQQPKKKDI